MAPSDTQPEPTVPTLEDVAKAASVSTATVSRCLNSPERVSEKTRTKVMEAVRKLGYAPNFGAQALAAKRTNTFGAIIPTMDNAIFARGLQAFQEELHRNGVTLLVASSSYDPQLEEDQIRSLVARGADALLLIGHERTAQSYTFLEQRQIPCVVAWVYTPDAPRISVGFDNRQAMKSMGAEVIGLGHRRLGYISASRSDNDRARERFTGLCDAMREAGLDPSDLNLRETPYSIADGAHAFADLMGPSPRPTAILCGNDVLAAGALQQARKMGLSVPGDVSVTGFDDLDIAEIVTPPLTTMHVPHREMGRLAAQALLDMRNGTPPQSSIRLDATIRWRKTLGPPPET